MMNADPRVVLHGFAKPFCLDGREDPSASRTSKKNGGGALGGFGQLLNSSGFGGAVTAGGGNSNSGSGSANDDGGAARPGGPAPAKSVTYVDGARHDTQVTFNESHGFPVYIIN